MMVIYNADFDCPLDFKNDELLKQYLKVLQKIDDIVKLDDRYILDIQCLLNRGNEKCFTVALVKTNNVNDELLKTFGYLRTSRNCNFMKRLKTFKTDLINNYYLPIIEKNELEKNLSLPKVSKKQFKV